MATPEKKLTATPKGRQIPADFEGGLFKCLVTVNANGATYSPGELVELTAAQAYPIRDVLSRVQ